MIFCVLQDAIKNALIECVGPVIDGLEEDVMTMNVGEVASFTIPPQHAFGGVGSKQYHLAGKDGFGCLFECQIFGHFSLIMDK